MPLEVVHANNEQMLEITILSTGFAKESEFVKVDVEHSMTHYMSMVANGYGGMLALMDDGKVIGGLGWVKAPDLHYPRMLLIETFWYVPPENRGGGLKLLAAFEDFAREKGVDACAMIHMVDSQPEALEHLYERKGYRLMEKHYVKEIQP